MCARYTLATPIEDILQGRFEPLLHQIDHQPRYNVAPTQQVLTILNDGGDRRAETMRWGLVPFWAKDLKIGSRMINARSETLATKSSFRTPFRKRRCLIVADGFFEWRKDGKEKIPTYIFLKNRELFTFAGLWENWKSPEGEVVRSCTIITTEPNDLMEPIHNRMPVMLSDETEALWLDPMTEDPEPLGRILTSYPAELMESYEVSNYVNSPGNHGPECIAPLTV